MIDVVLAASTVATVPLKVTISSTSSESKFNPVIVTLASTRPLPGLKLVICGVGMTIKFVLLVIVSPLTLIVIFPVDAPTGTTAVMLLGVEVLTSAVTSLNFTTWSEGVVLKSVPEIITVAPAAPLNGLKSIILGVGSTEKSELLVRVILLRVKEIFPVVAPDGTVVVILVDVELVTVAEVPLNIATLLAGIILKFVPEMVTVAPTAPLAGAKLLRVGVGNTVKFVALLIVTPLTDTEIGPVAAPDGTMAVMVVGVEEITWATTPLNETMLLVIVGLKLVPEIVMVAPADPLSGLMLVIVGEGNMVKSVALVTVTPFTVNLIFPVDAPTGTEVTILVAVDNEIKAVVLLNLRT